MHVLHVPYIFEENDREQFCTDIPMERGSTRSWKGQKVPHVNPERCRKTLWAHFFIFVGIGLQNVEMSVLKRVIW